jgi:hypothetical protein
MNSLGRLRRRTDTGPITTNTDYEKIQKLDFFVARNPPPWTSPI